MASTPTPGSTGLSTEAGSMFEVVEEDVDGVRLPRVQERAAVVARDLAAERDPR